MRPSALTGGRCPRRSRSTQSTLTARTSCGSSNRSSQCSDGQTESHVAESLCVSILLVFLSTGQPQRIFTPFASSYLPLVFAGNVVQGVAHLQQVAASCSCAASGSCSPYYIPHVASHALGSPSPLAACSLFIAPSLAYAVTVRGDGRQREMHGRLEHMMRSHAQQACRHVSQVEGQWDIVGLQLDWAMGFW